MAKKNIKKIEAKRLLVACKLLTSKGNLTKEGKLVYEAISRGLKPSFLQPRG